MFCTGCVCFHRFRSFLLTKNGQSVTDRPADIHSNLRVVPGYRWETWYVFGLTILFLVYFVYATPIIMLGVWRYKKRGFGEDPGEDWDPPNVSVLVPVKNEEKVVGRLLDALVRLDYPRENLEVVVVEDESRDRTLDICKIYSAKYPWIKVFHRDASLGKGDALNFAFHQSSGEIVATFDADDVPEEQAVKKALRYFNSSETGAVHGFHRKLNLR